MEEDSTEKDPIYMNFYPKVTSEMDEKRKKYSTNDIGITCAHTHTQHTHI